VSSCYNQLCGTWSLWENYCYSSSLEIPCYLILRFIMITTKACCWATSCARIFPISFRTWSVLYTVNTDSSLLHTIKCHGWVVNTPSSYSGGLGLYLGPEAGNLRFSWFSSVPQGECLYSSIKLGHDYFLPNPIPFIIHLIIWCYTVLARHVSTIWSLSSATKLKQHLLHIFNLTILRGLLLYWHT
jgi:hypothetical protein